MRSIGKSINFVRGRFCENEMQIAGTKVLEEIAVAIEEIAR